METVISRGNKHVIISYDNPVAVIGERLNPTGRKKLTAALEAGDVSIVAFEASSQVEAGAHILDVNAGVSAVEEAKLLPRVLQVVMETVDVPVCIDSSDPKALRAALEVYDGKALVNSVNAEESSWEEILPLVKEYGAAVVGLPMDGRGIPDVAEKRLEMAVKIAEKVAAFGIPPEDLVIDCLATAMGADMNAGKVALRTIELVKKELGVNMTMGASNVSFGLPERPLINSAFLTMAIRAGVTCPIVDAAKALPCILASDVIMGRDAYAQRYIQGYRSRQKSQNN